MKIPVLIISSNLSIVKISIEGSKLTAIMASYHFTWDEFALVFWEDRQWQWDIIPLEQVVGHDTSFSKDHVYLI